MCKGDHAVGRSTEDIMCVNFKLSILMKVCDFFYSFRGGKVDEAWQQQFTVTT